MIWTAGISATTAASDDHTIGERLSVDTNIRSAATPGAIATAIAATVESTSTSALSLTTYENIEGIAWGHC